MKYDIEKIEDLELIAGLFLNRISSDALLGPFFKSSIDTHKQHEFIHAFSRFLSNIILYTGDYEGNPMQFHQNLAKNNLIKVHHFIKWNQLFTEVVDENYAGVKAEELKQKTLSVSAQIQIKLFKN